MPGPTRNFPLQHMAIVIRDLDSSITFSTEHFVSVVEAIARDVSDPSIAAEHQFPSVRFSPGFLRFGPTQVVPFQFDAPTDGCCVVMRADDMGSGQRYCECLDVAAAYN